MAYGVPAGLYLTYTPAEVGALVEAIAERERRLEEREDFRTAWLVAETMNGRRSKTSDKYWTPWDFIKKPGGDVTVESRETFKARLLSFAMAHNAANASKRKKAVQ